MGHLASIFLGEGLILMATKSSIGVIVEDQTDLGAIKSIIRRLLSDPARKVLGKASKGCSMMRRKAKANVLLLVQRGCDAIIIVHDLDRNPQNQQLNDKDKLRHKLESTIEVPDGIQRCICIPVEELEAWFLADASVVSKVSRGSCSRPYPSPELVAKPKELLFRLSRDSRGKARYSTNDNEVLAKELDLDICAERCPSFAELRDFVLECV